LGSINAPESICEPILSALSKTITLLLSSFFFNLLATSIAVESPATPAPIINISVEIVSVWAH